MTARTYVLTFSAVTLGVGLGLRHLGSWHMHAFLIYPLAGIGLVFTFGSLFLLTEPPEPDACARCGKEGKFKRSGLQAWPICPECRKTDHYEVEEVGKV
jgi:hypothetical protein